MRPPDRPTLLLLSGGSLVGQNVVQALADRRDQMQLIATNSDPREPSLADFDEDHLVPTTRESEEIVIGKICDISATTRIDLIIPCRDDDVLACARLIEQRPELASKVLAGSVDTALAMLDKYASWEFSRDHDLPFARSALLSDRASVERAIEAIGFPMIVKPRSGFASHKTAIVTEPAALMNMAPNDELMAQEYLGDSGVLRSFLKSAAEGSIPLFHSFEGDKVSIQTLIGPEGGYAEIVVTRNVMRSGVSVSVELDPSSDALDLGERCAREFSSAGWRGPLNIQCLRRPDGSLGIHEYNGRFTGATASRMHLGHDEVGTALRLFAGIDLPPPGLRFPRLAIRKQMVTRSVAQSFETQLRTTGHWRRDEQ
jgi:carbamoyl-phosphate synthase large subunit